MPTPPTYFESIACSSRLPTYSLRTPLAPLSTYSSSSSLSQRTSVTDVDVVTSSGNITLNLGSRRHPSRLAVHQIYHKQGIVKGCLEIDGIENARSIEIKLVGSVKNALTESNGTILSYSKRHFLDISQPLFDSKHDSPTQLDSPSPCSSRKRLPFCIRLPSYCQDGKTPLPPSSDLVHTRTSSRVKYSVRVEMKKKGMRRNESLETEIYYLPASFSQSSSQWELVPSTHLYSDSMPTRSVQLRLPPQRYFPAGYPIHFQLETRDKSIAQAIRDKAQIKLVRQIDFNVNGTRTKKESVLGVTDMWSIEDIKGLFVVAGSVAGGCLGGDASWSIDGMVAVSYMLRIEMDAHVKSPTSLHISFHKEEPVILTSHGIESSGNIPAMGMLKCFRIQRSTTSSVRDSEDRSVATASYMAFR